MNQFKGYNSGTTKASRTKLDVHHIVIVIHISYKFDEIPFSSYIVMAPDGRTDMDKPISLRLRRVIIKGCRPSVPRRVKCQYVMNMSITCMLKKPSEKMTNSHPTSPLPPPPPIKSSKPDQTLNGPF